MTKLCLGTAQFGMNYGVANKKGQPSQAEVNEMVQSAWESGIDLFDTAQAYGSSEIVLGKAFEVLGISDRVKVITKLSPELEKRPETLIIKSVRRSLANLRVPKLFSLMLHRGEWLSDWEKYYGSVFRKVIAEGMTESAGVSIYTLEEFDRALEIPEILTIQMPFNVLDQRARVHGCFEKARTAGKLLFLRSIYLQGALTLENIPEKIKFGLPHFKRFEDLSLRLGISKKELAFQFALENSSNAVLVLGLESTLQLSENVKLAAQDRWVVQKNLSELYQLSENVPEKLINPALWEK